MESWEVDLVLDAMRSSKVNSGLLDFWLGVLDDASSQGKHLFYIS